MEQRRSVSTQTIHCDNANTHDAVQSVNGGLGAVFVFHGDETEATRSVGLQEARAGSATLYGGSPVAHVHRILTLASYTMTTFSTGATRPNSSSRSASTVRIERPKTPRMLDGLTSRGAWRGLAGALQCKSGRDVVSAVGTNVSPV